MNRTLILSLLLVGNLFADPKAAVEAAVAGEEAFATGEYGKALEFFTKAIAEDNTNPSFYGNRGSTYSYLGKLDEALKDYDTAIQKVIAKSSNPKDKRLAYFFYNRGYAYEHSGRVKEALVEYQKTIELDPLYPDAHGNTAWILSTHPDAEMRYAKKALEYALIEAKLAKNATNLDTLAAAYASNGQFDEARRYQKLAVGEAGSEDDRKEFSGRLRLYEQNKPYVELEK